MGRYNFAPQRVHQAATRLLEARRLAAPPPWYNIVANLPPSQRLVRPALQASRKPGKKASKLFQPVKIEYEEDKLRAEFFGDHPWELARPRQVLEDDGKDYQRQDWSRLQQPGKRLDGESVVQRQAWLMGLIRHEMDFTADAQLCHYLQSPAFQRDVGRFITAEYNVDMECPIPAQALNPDAQSVVSIRLTYHPKQAHDFNAAKKHIVSLLADRGITSNTINRRSFDIAFAPSSQLLEQLSSVDFSPIRNQYQISASLGQPVTIKPLGEEAQELQTITFAYHRNFAHSLAAAIASISSSLSVPVTQLIHKPLPTADPDTFNAYSKAHAYDVARKEFYAARHRQDIERRVAREEALFTGAEFGPSALEVGMQLEDKTYEEWKVWAIKEIALQKQLAGSAYTGIADESVELDTEDSATQEGLDEIAESVPGSKRGQEALGGAIVHP